MLSSCGPSRYQANDQIKNQDAGIAAEELELPPVFDQELVSTTYSLHKMNDEKASQYDYTQVIQNGDKKMYVGYSHLKNVKSVYNRTTSELEVSGVAEILTSDRKSIKASQEFHLKGEYKAKTGTINLRPVDDKKQSSDKLQIRAVVTCFKNQTVTGFDCSKAIIDVFIKDGDKYFTEQLESTTFEKPKLVGGKDSKQATELTINVTPEQPASKTTIIDVGHDKEAVEAEDLAEQEEGDDEAIEGRYEGQAGQVELEDIFSDNDDKKDEQNDQIDSSVKQNRNGRLMLTNQADGSPDNGRLRNASFLKTHVDTYNLADKVVIANSSTKNYYGTQEMMDILEAIGEKMHAMEKNKIFISRISAKHGGPLPPSVSHQIGMDVDLGYPTYSGQVGFPVVASNGVMKRSDYSSAKTLELFKFLMTQTVTPIDRIFADQSIINHLCRAAREAGKFSGSEKATYARLFENLQHVKGHGNHFHLRLRCVPNQPECRHKIYKKMKNCG